jgi:hypothetical protein
MTGIIAPLEIEDADPATPTDAPTGDLAAVRDLVLKAHPDVVPELIGGATIAALLASVAPAQAAYTRIAGALKPSTPAPTPSVPAGGNPPVVIDLDRLPAAEKIRRGLATTRLRSAS